MSNVLLGTGIGDSLGMHFEGLSSTSNEIRSWDGITYLPSRPRTKITYGTNVQLNPGQYTDDTCLSIVVAKSLIDNNGFNPDHLSKSYVDYVTSDANRGYGHTTLAAIKNLQEGKHWSESGIPESYGNAPAMKSSSFGVFFRNNIKELIKSVKIDCAITHKSTEAEAGALAIALTVAFLSNNDSQDLLTKVIEHLPDSNIKNTLSSLDELIKSDTPSNKALTILGTGFDIKQTVPAVLYCFLKHDTYINAVSAMIRAGGDTDTNCSIVCALFAAKYGSKYFLKYHVNNLENYEQLLLLDSQLFNKPTQLKTKNGKTSKQVSTKKAR
jgi:ADP-ribosyl-[dinitrogen reductase] hydrolase